MRRGDVVVVAVNGEYGKPRPAVIVQTDAFPDGHASVIICSTTTELSEAPDFRITVEPKPGNGLREKSQIMVDKPVTVKRERIGQVIGHLTVEDIVKLDTALAFVVGLAD
ncbi:MAG TPA: type II toxin-antitoxin system PemK/MazF family toxin [Telmatospirillum sp.]|nr:type II toxin-antitoxin system PemK/MazF family toxin [Telmatospirillum sp.]